jgi:hypothetical protein
VNGDDTFANRINNKNVVVGDYADAGARFHGFRRSPSGEVSSIDYPKATMTDANDINDDGVVVGDYIDSQGAWHGYVLAAH